MTNHLPFFCELCDRWTFLCGKCGNNACNGGTGKVFVDGELIPCDQCESAYQLDINTPQPKDKP